MFITGFKIDPAGHTHWPLWRLDSILVLSADASCSIENAFSTSMVVRGRGARIRSSGWRWDFDRVTSKSNFPPWLYRRKMTPSV